MPIKVRKEELEVLVCADVAETDIESLVRCCTSKFIPPRSVLAWHEGFVYCSVFRWIERPTPRIYVFEICRAPMPDFKPTVEIRIPSPIAISVVRARGMDLDIIKEALKRTE